MRTLAKVWHLVEFWQKDILLRKKILLKSNLRKGWRGRIPQTRCAFTTGLLYNNMEIRGFGEVPFSRADPKGFLVDPNPGRVKIPVPNGFLVHPKNL
jgi:hypothetical protein